MSFNSPDEVEARLTFLGPNQDQWNIQNILDSAHNQLAATVGRQVSESLEPTRKKQRKFQLAFSQVESVERVEGMFTGREEEVAQADYTVTKDTGQIEFDSNWADDNLYHQNYRLNVDYVPTVFKEVELMLALEEILNLYVAQTGDEEKRAMFERYSERRQELVERINKTTQNLVDRHRGDTLHAGSPRRGR